MAKRRYTAEEIVTVRGRGTLAVIVVYADSAIGGSGCT